MAKNKLDCLLEDDPLFPSQKIPTPIMRSTSPHDFDYLLNVTPEKSGSLKQFVKNQNPKRHVQFQLERNNNHKHHSGKEVFADVSKSEKSMKAKKHSSDNANKSRRKDKICSGTNCVVSEYSQMDGFTKKQNPIHKLCPTKLETPKLNSTGALSKQLQNIELEEFDVGGAVARTLRQSESVRNQFAERIAEAVNVPKECKKYSGLVSIDVPTEVADSHASVLRVRRPKKSKQKMSSKASASQQPDIMECFEPDMLTDVADLSSATHIPHYEIKSRLVPADSAFDIYRHIQQWQDA